MNLNPYIYSQNLMQKAETETFKKRREFSCDAKSRENLF